MLHWLVRRIFNLRVCIREYSHFKTITVKSERWFFGSMLGSITIYSKFWSMHVFGCIGVSYNSYKYDPIDGYIIRTYIDDIRKIYKREAEKFIGEEVNIDHAIIDLINNSYRPCRDQWLWIFLAVIYSFSIGLLLYMIIDIIKRYFYV